MSTTCYPDTHTKYALVVFLWRQKCVAGDLPSVYLSVSNSSPTHSSSRTRFHHPMHHFTYHPMCFAPLSAGLDPEAKGPCRLHFQLSLLRHCQFRYPMPESLPPFISHQTHTPPPKCTHFTTPCVALRASRPGIRCQPLDHVCWKYAVRVLRKMPHKVHVCMWAWPFSCSLVAGSFCCPGFLQALDM